jgi:hypothetical protein
MNPATTSISTLDQWQIIFHETMAALLRAQEAVKRQFGFWGVLNGLWRCSRDLKILNSSLKALSELPDGVLSEEFIKAQIPELRKLLSSIDDLVNAGKSHGWTNRTVTSAPLGQIRMRGEYVADYLDALEMSVDPEVLKAIEEGRSQINRGECEVMERLF